MMRHGHSGTGVAPAGELPSARVATLGGPKVGFWGHGRNFQLAWGTEAFSEFVKRSVSRQAHWWFAYNATSAKVVAELGFPPGRIMSVQNAIDTSELMKLSESISDEEVETARKRMGSSSRRIGLFVGGMYREKRLRFLLEACEEIKRTVPDFEVLFVGAGEDQGVVEHASRRLPWVHTRATVWQGESLVLSDGTRATYAERSGPRYTRFLRIGCTDGHHTEF